MADDRMLQVLEAIRDEVRATNARLETLDGHVQNTNARLESLEGRVQGTNAQLVSLDGRVQDTNARLESLEGRVQSTNAQLETLDGRVQNTNVRLGAVEQRLQSIEQHSADLGDRFDRMARRQTESEMRLSTEVTALADATRQVRELLATRLDDHRLIVDHERRLVEVEKRRT